MPPKQKTTDTNQNWSSNSSSARSQGHRSGTKKENNPGLPSKRSSSGRRSTKSHDESKSSTTVVKPARSSKDAVPVPVVDAPYTSSKNLDPELVQTFCASYFALCKGIDPIQTTCTENPGQSPWKDNAEMRDETERLRSKLCDFLPKAEYIDSTTVVVQMDFMRKVSSFLSTAESRGLWKAEECKLNSGGDIQSFMRNALRYMKTLLGELNGAPYQLSRQISEACKRTMSPEEKHTDPITQLIRPFFSAPLLAPEKEVKWWREIVLEHFLECSYFLTQFNEALSHVPLHWGAFRSLSKADFDFQGIFSYWLKEVQAFEYDVNRDQKHKEYFEALYLPMKRGQRPSVIGPHLQRLATLAENMGKENVIDNHDTSIQTVKELFELAPLLKNSTSATRKKAIEMHQQAKRQVSVQGKDKHHPNQSVPVQSSEAGSKKSDGRQPCKKTALGRSRQDRGQNIFII